MVNEKINSFREELYSEIQKSLKNNYGVENYDAYRFGPYPSEPTKQVINKKIRFKAFKKSFTNKIKEILNLKNPGYYLLVKNFIGDYSSQMQRIWENLSKKDRDLYVKIIAFRLLGREKIKLPLNNPEYWRAIEKAMSLIDEKETYNPNFLHYLLYKFNLNTIGYNISFFYTAKGVAIDYIIEQYAYKKNNKNLISAESGDIVLDLGGCWGDTALYFAHKVGVKGKVFSFEFIPNNKKIFNKNLALNPDLEKRIQLVEMPVTHNSGDTIYYSDNGPSSRVLDYAFEGYEATCKTISLDDYVKENDFIKLDMIKMDIEGAEPLALKGAIETIKKFKPKLAIAIYHSKEDFVNIPNWILNLNLGYEIFIDHFSIHAEETVCFAKVKEDDVL